MNHMIDALDDVDPEVIARLERKLNDIKHGKNNESHHTAKMYLRADDRIRSCCHRTYGNVHYLPGPKRVFQGPVLNYVLIDMIIAYTLVQIIWRSTRQLVLSQNG